MQLFALTYGMFSSSRYVTFTNSPGQPENKFEIERCEP